MNYDAIIIGGGASGLTCAIQLKRLNPTLSVLILERLSRVGKKIAVTGNGRCNISNKDLYINRYHGENPEFCRFALSNYGTAFCTDFFYSLGVPFISEADKLFPASLQASSVVDALRFECDKLGVETKLDTLVTDIKRDNSKYSVKTTDQTFICKSLVAAGGLLSGGEKLGCDGGLLSIIKKMGVKTVETTPSIVQIKTETDIVKQLKGIKVDANVTLKCDGKKIRTEFGETLFCDYGLSGPPVLQISRGVAKNKNKAITLSLDILPETSFNDLILMLNDRKKILSYRTADEFFTGMLNKRLGQVLLKISGFKMNEKVCDFDSPRLKKLCSNIKNFEFKVTGTGGFINSQATAGGLNTDEFNDSTMMSKGFKNLYAIGEILDIDGDCGGFNLAWAFASAFCAANSIAGDNK